MLYGTRKCGLEFKLLFFFPDTGARPNGFLVLGLR